MAVSEKYTEFVQDQLEKFGEVTMKKMFGGIGIYHEGLMFAMIGKDVLRFKVDASNQADYEAYGSKPLYNEKKKRGMPYWEVPAEIIEHPSDLAKWASKSYQIAVDAKK